MNIRPLTADEIECRIGIIKAQGLSLLLYKDARTDQNILDEVFGTMNWQRSHQILDGNLYCTVSVWDEEKKQWISKQDVGTESFTEKEKGQASDCFKRACFNLGIGRELYTAPFIWIPSSLCEIKKNENDKYTCSDRFEVFEIGYDQKRNINKLVIVNEKSRVEVFRFGEDEVKETEDTKKQIFKDGLIDDLKLKSIRKKLKDDGIEEKFICESYKLQFLGDMKDSQFVNLLLNYEKVKAAFDEWKNH